MPPIPQLEAWSCWNIEKLSAQVWRSKTFLSKNFLFPDFWSIPKRSPNQEFMFRTSFHLRGWTRWYLEYRGMLGFPSIFLNLWVTLSYFLSKSLGFIYKKHGSPLRGPQPNVTGKGRSTEPTDLPTTVGMLLPDPQVSGKATLECWDGLNGGRPEVPNAVGWPMAHGMYHGNPRCLTFIF